MEPLALTFTLAILIGSTCITILGSILALQKRKRWGYLINTKGVICFWIAALMPYLHSHHEQNIDHLAPAVELDAFTVKHVSPSLPASSLEPVGSRDEAGTFLASRNGKTYHLPTCSHYAPFIRGPIWYVSDKEAKADGKRPCSECLGKPADLIAHE